MDLIQYNSTLTEYSTADTKKLKREAPKEYQGLPAIPEEEDNSALLTRKKTNFKV